jgi:oligoribonuclease
VRPMYAAIDVETTGLDPLRHQIIELACVIDGLNGTWDKPLAELPTLRFFVDPGEIYGNVVALAMNARILAELAKPPRERSVIAVAPQMARETLIEFLKSYFGTGKVVLAGKNVAGFDIPFLRGLWAGSGFGWPERMFHYRVLDPGMLYFDPETDATVPGLGECCKRAGIEFEGRHDALDDCHAVVRLLRAYYAKS